MELKIKSYQELSKDELYALLFHRSDVFVMEQNCVCRDVDYVDQQAAHLWLEENGEIKAYCRVFRKDEHTVKIGRVLSVCRGQGFGKKIFAEGMAYAGRTYPDCEIELAAQCPVRGFYEKFGFVAVSEPFLYEGLDHIIMRLKTGKEDDR